MSEHISGYPSIYHLGHKALEGFTDDPLLVEEKVDGSQFSFRAEFDGSLSMRSKGADVIEGAPSSGMFQLAIETVKRLAPDLGMGWTYRGEYLMKPKHNALAYDRIPLQHVILFDIETGPSTFLSPEDKEMEAARLGLECVPVLYEGHLRDVDQLRSLLSTISVLGSQQIEGVVLKNYAKFGPDKKVLMAKYVSEAFKEVHKGEWRKSKPGRQDVLEELIGLYRTPARWNKAVQHLRERGELLDGPQDIGPLMKEVAVDIHKECRDDIAAALWKHFWPQMSRGVTAGLPQWYKDELATKAFTNPAGHDHTPYFEGVDETAA